MSNVFDQKKKRAVVRKIMESLYRDELLKINPEIVSIIEAHAAARGDGIKAFIYDDQIYCIHGVDFNRRMVRSLSTHLVHQMKDFLKKKEAITRDTIYLKTQQYLVNAMALCKVPADVYKILPSDIYDYYSAELGGDFTIPATLTEDQICAFQERNSKLAFLFNKRRLKSIITGGQ